MKTKNYRMSVFAGKQVGLEGRRQSHNNTSSISRETAVLKK